MTEQRDVVIQQIEDLARRLGRAAMRQRVYERMAERERREGRSAAAAGVDADVHLCEWDIRKALQEIEERTRRLLGRMENEGQGQ